MVIFGACRPRRKLKGEWIRCSSCLSTCIEQEHAGIVQSLTSMLQRSPLPMAGVAQSYPRTYHLLVVEYVS